MSEKPNPQYLGDGVYVSHDGWQIWLAANHHENLVIAMEPEVFQSFIEYAAQDPRYAAILKAHR